VGVYIYKTDSLNMF